jgi:hypothetical protein
MTSQSQHAHQLMWRVWMRGRKVVVVGRCHRWGASNNGVGEQHLSAHLTCLRSALAACCGGLATKCQWHVVNDVPGVRGDGDDDGGIPGSLTLVLVPSSSSSSSSTSFKSHTFPQPFVHDCVYNGRVCQPTGCSGASIVER